MEMTDATPAYLHQLWVAVVYSGEMLEIQLHFISAVAIFLAAAVPIYLTLRLQGNLRKLTLLLLEIAVPIRTLLSYVRITF